MMNKAFLIGALVLVGVFATVGPVHADCSSLRSSLRSAQDWLSHNTSNLREAQRSLSDAQQRHREALEEYRRAKTDTARGYAETRIRFAESAIQNAENRVRYSQDKVDYYNREIASIQDRMSREGCR